MHYINKAMAYDILASNKHQYEATIKNHIDTVLQDNEPQWKKIVDHMYMNGVLPPAVFKRANGDFLVVGVTSLCPSTGERLYFPIAAEMASMYSFSSWENGEPVDISILMPLPYHPVLFKRPNARMPDFMRMVRERVDVFCYQICFDKRLVSREDSLMRKMPAYLTANDIKNEIEAAKRYQSFCSRHEISAVETAPMTFYTVRIPVKSAPSGGGRIYLEPRIDWRYPEKQIYSGFCSTVGEGFPADPIMRYKDSASLLFRSNSRLDDKLAKNGYFGVDYSQLSKDVPSRLLKEDKKKGITVSDQSEEKAREEEEEVLTMWHGALQTLLHEELVFAMPHEIFLMHRMALDAMEDLPLY